MSNIDDDIIKTKLAVLEMRFNKIDPTEYALSYSGGRDSHLLYWFIKENNLPIKIIGVNTRMEHIEIRERMEKYCDEVLTSKIMPFEIKENYGIPCFSKQQDEFIKRYQNWNRSKNTLSKFDKNSKSKFKLNNTAIDLTINGALHRVSNLCCDYTKKIPFHKFEKKHKVKSITGERRTEGILRDAIQTCLNSKGKFTPIFDFTDELMRAIEIKYSIKIPNVYDCINRTGCMGCPYGIKSGNTIKELNLLTPNQREFAINLFRESYDVRGVAYNQMMFN